MFDFADGSFLPQIINPGITTMNSSHGFSNSDVDGLFLRNSNSQISSLFYLIIGYFFVKIFTTVRPLKREIQIQPEVQAQKVQNSEINVKNETLTTQNENKPLNIGTKINGYAKMGLEFFEWGAFLGFFDAAFLNLCVFSFLQLQNSSVKNNTELISFIAAFFVLGLLVLFLIIIFNVIYQILLSKVSLTLYSTENKPPDNVIPLPLEMQFKQTEIEKFEMNFSKSFQMVYSLFVPGKIVQQGYYIVSAGRKFIFAFFLVFAYTVPTLILSVWISLNLTMIFVLFKYRPYKELIFTFRDMITEVCFALIHIVTFPFFSSSFVADKKKYQNMGIVIIAFIIIILLVQFICIMYDSYQSIMELFKKKEIIPDTVKVPATPSHSNIEIIPPTQHSTEYQKLKHGLRKYNDFIKLTEIHKKKFITSTLPSEFQERLQQLELAMSNAKNIQEFDSLEKQYDNQMFMAQVKLSMDKYVDINPESTHITPLEIQELLPVQYDDFCKKNPVIGNPQTVIQLVNEIQSNPQISILSKQLHNYSQFQHQQTSNDANKQQNYFDFMEGKPINQADNSKSNQQLMSMKPQIQNVNLPYNPEQKQGLSRINSQSINGLPSNLKSQNPNSNLNRPIKNKEFIPLSKSIINEIDEDRFMPNDQSLQQSSMIPSKYKRKTQRQVNPINAIRVDNISSTLSQIKQIQ